MKKSLVIVSLLVLVACSNGDKAGELLSAASKEDEKGKTEEAITHLKEAEYMSAPDTIRYEIQMLLSKINSAANCRYLSLKTCRKAVEISKGIDDYNRKADCRNMMAEIYTRLGQTDSADFWLGQALPYAFEASSVTRADLYTNVARLYLRKDDILKATQYADAALKEDYSEKTNILIGDIKKAEGELLPAMVHWTIAAESDDDRVKIEALRKIISVSDTLGMTAQADEYQKRLAAVYQKVYEGGNTDMVMRQQTDFDTDRQRQKNRQLIGGVVLTSILLIAFLTLLWRRHRRNVEEKVSEMEKVISENHRRRHDDELLNADIVHLLHSLADKGRQPSAEQWQQLHSMENDFITTLNGKAMLSEREMKICVLTRLHFSPSEIATLTLSTPQAVTNSRVRLLSKIFGITGGAKEFDKRIMQL